MIIVELIIKNFKVFKSLHLRIDGAQLTVLDGPNGFGKTSLFDALELLFMGGVRRYQDIENTIIDRRSLCQGCSLLNNEAMPGDWLSVRAKIKVGDETLFLERAAVKEDLDQIKGLSNATFNLYSLASLDSERGEPVENDIQFMSSLLGEDYRRNFELFHYVEQEENTALLKQKGAERQSQIAHLFDIGNIQEKSSTLRALEGKVGKLCDKTQNTRLQELHHNWEEAKKLLQPEATRVPYARLLSVSNNAWDEESCVHPPEQYDQWLNDQGVLSRILSLVSNRQDFENHLFNKQLKKQLIPNTNVLELFLKFGHRVDSYQAFKLDVQKYNAAHYVLSELFIDLISSIKNDKLKLPLELKDVFPKEISIAAFDSQVDLIKKLLLSADQYQSSLAQLSASRDLYLRNFIEHQSNSEPNSYCPTCGHDWESNKELLESIEQQTQIFEHMASQTNGNITSGLVSLKTNFVEPIEEVLRNFMTSNRESILYKKAMVNLSEEQLAVFSNLRTKLDNQGVVYQDLFLDSYNIEISPDTAMYVERIKPLKKPVNQENIESDFDTIFSQIFNDNLKELQKITPDEVKQKILYLRQLRSESVSVLVSERHSTYTKEKSKFDRAKKLKRHLNKLRTSYENEIKDYLDKVVKEIEIHFHIYSGRLMQNNQQGLGVFIENDGKSIAFRETPEQVHDALFSMSSGQLAALVLSFKLALNKRYAKHGLLLIDDPVQTLDEINVAGFIDLLRTDFNDNQIIISTHEDRMSTYFRYKFEKFGFTHSRVNFMEESKAILEEQ
ncbi:purine NTPase [Vibrio sp. VGrn 2]|uniref:AAA family ATPase n=1 Tax=Vibrio sp. VGrn 2 TaxID=2419839 RepID=UPI00128DC268|nr:AAA family ATPase [Vibrio sp. VGrn 2]MPS38376.1 purine NTPase [Vibrio sp. VGrn 2]